MSFPKFTRTIGPIIALALAAGLNGCNSAKIEIDGEEGKTLAELDLSAPAPHKLVMLGPDAVEITSGDKLAIRVDGDADAAALMRFTLKDGTLGILRKGKLFGYQSKHAVVHVTMPPASELTMAGSGTLTADALADEAKVTIAGSGDVSTPNLRGKALELTIAGSGTYHAAGSLDSLDLTIAGSGSIAAEALKAATTKVMIAGSGNAVFASDGVVDAQIMGSGQVTVKGRAHCTVSALGSGKLVCETPATVKAGDDAEDKPDKEDK